MTINSTTRKTNPLVGNGNAHTYPFAFKVFSDADVVVKKLEASTSIETTLQLGANNDYIVTLNQDQNGSPGGSITLKSGGNNQNLASGFSIVITSALDALQGTDLTNQGGFYPEVINDALDKSVILHQQQQDELDRSIKFSLTNTIGSLEITENANARKNKVLAFDNAGEFSVESEIGTYRGNWAASTAYAVRDIVKDTSTNNVFLCNTAHTSSGAQPLTTNTHSANWDLLVDAATATTQANTATAQATAAASSAAAALTSKNAAAASATAAATSETNANTHKNDAQTAKTAAETAKTAAETAKTAAEAALDSFDDRYLGAKSSDPTLDNDGNALLDGAIYWNTSSNVTKIYDLGNTSWDLLKLPSSDQTKVNTVAGISSNVTTVAGIASNVTAVAGNATNINAVAGNNSNITSVANNSSNINSAVSNASNINAAVSNASNINAVAGNASNINTVAGNNSNINTVAGANSNITTVATNINNVNAIATDIAKIQTVANDLNETVSEIETAANDLNETTSEIDTVANAIANVDNVGNNIANVNTVAGISSNVTSVAGNATNVNTVAGAITNVNNVGGSIANVNTCATNLSGINSFAERYRTDNTGNNPSTSLHSGDLFFNQGSGKLLVYNGNTSAWEETQSVGNFFINTIGSYSGTGGNSATFNGSAYKFTLSNAGTFAQQMIVSINGVVQKPNSGSGQPSEGFALDGANIVFSSPPPTGADYFIVTIGASVSIGTPSNNTVTSAHIVNGSIVNEDINASAAIALSKLATSGTANNTTFLRGDGAWTVVATDLVGDTSPQLGGDLDTNDHHILLDQDHYLYFVTNGGSSFLGKTASGLYLQNNGDLHLRGDDVYIKGDDNTKMAKFIEGGAAELYHDNSLKFETTSSGTRTTGAMHINDGAADGNRISVGNGGDLKIFHTNPNTYIQDSSSALVINSARLDINNAADNEQMARFTQDGAVELYYDNAKKLETSGAGIRLNGVENAGAQIQVGIGNDIQIEHDGSNSYLTNSTGHLGVQSNTLYLQSKTSGEYYFKAVKDGAVELYWDNDKKLETKDLGLTVSGSSPYAEILVQSSSAVAGGRVQIWASGTSREVGFAEPTSQQWFVRYDKNTSTGYRYEYHWQSIQPAANNSYDLGSSNYRWRNIYTNDLNLSNEGSSNDVDGTWGSYTIQEGAEDLFLVNKRNGKKYKFNLTEVS